MESKIDYIFDEKDKARAMAFNKVPISSSRRVAVTTGTISPDKSAPTTEAGMKEILARHLKLADDNAFFKKMDQELSTVIRRTEKSRDSKDTYYSQL